MKNIKVYNYLEILKGKEISNIVRTVNLVCINLINVKDEKEETNELSINIQCSCRMLNKEEKKIIFASADMYEPKTTDEWSSNFDWDVQGGNLFDELSKNWITNNKNIYITDFQFNMWGDLRLILSNSDIFEILVNCSLENEAWRFLEVNSNRDHFVVTGNGVVFEYDIE